MALAVTDWGECRADDGLGEPGIYFCEETNHAFCNEIWKGTSCVCGTQCSLGPESRD
jgi:hypothetical protein